MPHWHSKKHSDSWSKNHSLIFHTMLVHNVDIMYKVPYISVCICEMDHPSTTKDFRATVLLVSYWHCKPLKRNLAALLGKRYIRATGVSGIRWTILLLEILFTVCNTCALCFNVVRYRITYYNLLSVNKIKIFTNDIHGVISKVYVNIPILQMRIYHTLQI